MVQRRETGRPELLYGRRPKPGEEEHDVRVTDVELLLGHRIERGPKVGKTQADGIAEIGGEQCWIEVENSGKKSGRQMWDKWKRYAGVTGFVLVIATSERRMERLRQGAELVKDVALFSTFERLRSVKQPWVDWYGNAAELGREGPAGDGRGELRSITQ